MPNMYEYVNYLAQEIGPRPAGTEEEQKAALFIEENLKGESGLEVAVEEFEGATGNDMTRLVCAGISLVAALLFMITSALAIPGLILSLIAVVLFVADYMGKPVVARFFKKGVSQNVVAQYKPASAQGQGRGRKRKIIVVTRYDSGKVRPELSEPFVNFLGLANRISAGAILFLFVWMLIRSIFCMYPEGAVAVILNVVTVIAMLFVAMPLILKAMQQNAAYNDGANGSASGVAVVMELAKRVSKGSFAEFEEIFEEEPVVHGEQEALEQDVVPEGAQLVYDVEESVVQPEPEVAPEEEPSAEVAPAPERPEENSAPAVAAAAVVAAPVVQYVAAAPVPEPEDTTPDWFKAAQAKAKKTVSTAPASTYRSRYAVAFEAIDEMSSAPESVVEEVEEVAAPVQEAPSIEVAPEPEPQVLVEEEAVEQPAIDQPAQEQLVAEASAVSDVETERELVDVNEVLAEGVEAIPEVTEVGMPSFLFTAVEGGQKASEPEPEPYVENVPDFVGQPTETAGASALAETGRMPIVLPDVGETGLAPIEDLQQQRAPLADGAQAENGSVAAKGLLNMLPSIDPAPVESKRPALVLPSLSGAFNPVAAGAASGSAGMTGSFAPVGEELVEQVEDAEDLFIDDADDSEFDENFTETGAYAGPDYVEMPKSRFGGFFGKIFGKKNAAPAMTPSTNEWLDVDDDFDARSVGAARGDWSSFQDDSEWEQGNETIAFQRIDDFDAAWDEEEDRWEGGAFSAIKDKVAGAASGAAGAAAGAFGNVKERLPFGGGSQDQPIEPEQERRGRRRDRVEEPVQDFNESDVRPARRRGAGIDLLAQVGLEPDPSIMNESPQLVEEQEIIEEFQNPPIKTEVWFVALGSDLNGNAGMRAFMEQHASDMRGAMILEVEAVGAGELSLVGEEGSLKPVKASSRMKRFVRKANQALGIKPATVKLPWNDSASSYAASHGCQALHLVGMEGAAPALLGKAEDVTENVDEQALNMTADYIMEVLRAV